MELSSWDIRERGAGPPVLLIHGTGATSDFWGRAADRLAESCHLVTYDRRGTGRSANRPTGHHDVHAEDAAEVIRSLGVGQMTVVGWSMGGIVALCLAHRHPELVRRLVLQEPPLYARHDTSFDTSPPRASGSPASIGHRDRILRSSTWRAARLISCRHLRCRAAERVGNALESLGEIGDGSN
jgi:pimeloyl-ACP methyl ester carboxylesterase